ncbi:hypothetical protein SAMN05444411_11373 [Lutibacter oricola]|uniref:Uncharacterized protein n=1 Tax=Lutibacter oricola TaxID=762486 RepID=A0A1H3GA17_9FLAO|nr:hypothetical protein [Lutibacter oricola]SDX99334.1 hypothetical protein SAMN05444411_11373 [Lutibacter oricola]
MKTQKQNFANLNNSKVVKNIFKGILAIAISTSVISCDDKEETFEPKPDGLALLERFEENRAEAVQEFVLDAATGGIITGEQGSQVKFQPNAFADKDGGIVTGNITIQFVEIYDKGSMVLTDKSTLGEKPNGDKEALKSAGQFFIDAKQGSEELELIVDATVTGRPTAFADLDGGMKIFRAGDDLNSEEDWVEADEDDDGKNDDAEIRDGQGADGEFATYNYDIGTFGWTNLDRWYNYAGAKTDIFIDVPEGYTSDNCAVYLSYDGEPTALARMDVWNTTLEMFTEHYGLIPVGQEVHIIVVTEIDDELHYAIQGTTVVDNHIEIISSLSPTTQPALEAMINALP